MTSDPRLELLRHLVALTEEQLIAARALDGETMFALNERRADALFSLRVALDDVEPPDVSLREVILEEAQQLRRLERRLTHVAGVVLDTLDRLAPPTRPPPTYRATGRLVA